MERNDGKKTAEAVPLTAEEERELFRSLRQVKGVDSQYDQTLEELGEAVAAICRFRRGGIGNEGMADAIADAQIMLEQLQQNFNLKALTDEIRQRKLLLQKLKYNL